MAYSDYGGYAYRNGERMEKRSDAVLSPEGVQSTPGQWPGWTLPEARAGGCFHVLLGDGPIFVGLYKQSSVSVHRLGEEIDSFSKWDDQGDARESWVVDWDGHIIEVRWEETDNHYVYAKVTQPDGTVWTGFSGYGVGAGLEGAGYGADTSACEARVTDLFPEVAESTAA